VVSASLIRLVLLVFLASSSDSRLARARSPSLAILIQVLSRLSLTAPQGICLSCFSALLPPSAALVIAYSAFQYACDLAFPVSLKRTATPSRTGIRQSSDSLTGCSKAPHTGLATVWPTHSLLFLFLLAAYFPLITPARPSLIISLQIASPW